MSLFLVQKSIVTVSIKLFIFESCRNYDVLNNIIGGKVRNIDQFHFPLPHPKPIRSQCDQDFTFIRTLLSRQRKMKTLKR